MAEYIEREATLKLLRGASIAKYPSTFGVGILAAVKEIVDIPAADVAPVVHGRWIEREDYNNDVYYDCSACRESFCFIEGVPEENFYSYCPNCGARMDGEG